jgi:hypothetical protein
MKEYCIVYGAYVRMYADHTIEAENDEAARQAAIEEFKANAADLQWSDANYDNLALPSIVNLVAVDPPSDVLEGHDFPITPADARQYAADKMLEALEFVRMTFADIEASKRKGYYRQCPEIVDQAIAAATVIKDNALPATGSNANDPT